jgi:hypothetical protein
MENLERKCINSQIKGFHFEGINFIMKFLPWLKPHIYQTPSHPSLINQPTKLLKCKTSKINISFDMESWSAWIALVICGELHA